MSKLNDFYTPEEKMLITLRDELYKGSWEIMLQDLKDRLKNRPYVFKLVNRIEEDIERIENFQRFELKHNVKLVESGIKLEEPFTTIDPQDLANAKKDFATSTNRKLLAKACGNIMERASLCCPPEDQ